MVKGKARQGKARQGKGVDVIKAFYRFENHFRDLCSIFFNANIDIIMLSVAVRRL